MSGLPSPLVAQLALSVPVNGVLLPFKHSVDALHRFCRPLAFYNHESPFELSFSGSTLLLRCQGRNLLLCTRHQLENAHRRADEIALLVEDLNGRTVGLAPDAANRVVISVPEQANLADVFLAEFKPSRGGVEISRYFLVLDLDKTADLRQVRGEVVLAFAIGYPTRFQSVESEWSEGDGVTRVSIVSRWSKIYLEPSLPKALHHENRVPMELHREFKADIGDPDGFSGAPVFFIWQDASRQAHLGFGGMIAEANRNGRFLLYEARHLRQVISAL